MEGEWAEGWAEGGGLGWGAMERGQRIVEGIGKDGGGAGGE